MIESPPPCKRDAVALVWNGMIQAMDEMNVRIMGFRGITPEVWATQQQKRSGMLAETRL
jgi:hypothetical protein